MTQAFDHQPHTRVVFGIDSLNQLGQLAIGLGFKRTLLVADAGVVACGFVDRASMLLKDSGISVFTFHDFDSNPDDTMINKGRDFAAHLGIDSIIGLGGGSSMDCAKAINFLLTNGGVMKDYWGFGKAENPMLPMIGIPTTAGTGSEAQSYALIFDAETHAKMACGDSKAAFRIAILDPNLTVSQPPYITATAGFDAIAHAVETYVTTKRNNLSDMYSREAWRLLVGNYEKVLNQPLDIEARSAMQLGAYYAGVAIENSMLGATHACANPLTARYGTGHGEAIALLLPHVVRWNGRAVGERYQELLALIGQTCAIDDGGDALAAMLERLSTAANLPNRLRALNIDNNDLVKLSENAAAQWTGTFNPRPFDAAGAMEIYQCAF